MTCLSAHSEQYGDYREQLISWDAFESQVADYGAMLALPTEADAFVAQLRQRLADTAKRVDSAFPDNAHATFVGEELVIRKNSKQAAPAALLRVDEQLTARLAPKNILDILVEGERWLDLHKLFGPLSGFEGKIDNPRLRFVTTLFCYGCNLGPTQTARSLKDLSRKQVAWLNLHHMTEARLEKALVQVINAYNKFLLPKYWGSGETASADGTQWNLYEQKSAGRKPYPLRRLWGHRLLPCRQPVHRAVQPLHSLLVRTRRSTFSMGSSRTSPTCSPIRCMATPMRRARRPSAWPMCWASN